MKDTDIHAALGITPAHLDSNRLPLHEQPSLSELRVVDIDFKDKPFILHSSAAAAWIKMKTVPLKDRVELMQSRALANTTPGAPLTFLRPECCS